MVTILAREHNRVAAELAKMHPSWDNDKLYFEVTHMGQFPQDGEYVRNVAFYLTKRFDFFSTFLNCSREILPVKF